MFARSYLYVPADNAERLAKSVNRGADALIVDLEDGVSKTNKDLARTNLTQFLSQVDPSTQIWVRVNSEPEELAKDLEAGVHKNCHGIVLTKVSSSADIENLASLLSKLELQRGLENSIEISALVETAAGILNARDIACVSRVTRLQIGEADLSAELGISGAGAENTKQFARNMILFASAAAGINPPLAAISADFKDLAEFKRTTQQFKEWGYLGRSCIHPDQISIVNEVFTPSKVELENAQDLLERLSAAGGGVALDANGRMIDEAFARAARRTIEMGK
jgi:citrate lyase subunit beta/citryl-CoA lyase